jgi:hypothetical protein
MLALLAVYQIIGRLLQRRLGRETKENLEDVRALIAPLLTRNNGHRTD